MPLEKYKRDFIELAREKEVFKFGNFRLRSGRDSPYFIDMGNFSDGHSLYEVGQYYAKVIQDSKIDFKVLFGPAYKGIPLVCTASISWSILTGNCAPYVFNRKEVKDHGEGGSMVGHSLCGERVLIIDDVLTSGSAIQESISIIEANQGTVVGVIVAIDRQEKAIDAECSALQQLKDKYKVPVVAIVNLDDVIEYLSPMADKTQLVEEMKKYKAKHCSTI